MARPTVAATMVAITVALAGSGCASTTTGGELQRASAERPAGAEREAPGSLSHAEDEQFCSSHTCVANFPNGHGEVVRCSDGEWSHSGGVAGACADHGGEKGAAPSETSTQPPAEEASSGESEGSGSLSHEEDSQFCTSHHCIASFADGTGEVVECSDGEWSHSGGISGACSDHGGESTSPGSEATEPMGETATASSASPVEPLDDYWSDIRDHGFSAAYSYLAPSARTLSESEFVANEQRADIENAQFHGTVTAHSSGSATVAILSLVTHDAEFGCRSWSGSYTMVEEGGSWRIGRAAISPQSCPQ
jgi:hypothetical protein